MFKEFENINIITNINNQKYNNNMKYILIIGSTGAGKSTFIENYTNLKGLSSSDTQSETYCPIFYKKDNSNIVLIDTPGIFDSEGRTQEIYDQIVDVCVDIGYINYVLLFTRYSGRIDENIKALLYKYTIFLGDIEKSINICFTNVHNIKEKESIKNYDYSVFKVIRNVFILNENDTQNYELIWNDITKNLNDNKNIIQSKNMKKVFTLETQIAKLKDDVKYLEKEEKESKQKLNELNNLIKTNNGNKYTVDVDSFLCPGIVHGNKRCTRTINCHWYQNYLNNTTKK